LARFSGTTRKPQRASAGKVVGTGLVGHAVGTNLGTVSSELAAALAGNANGSAAAITAQIAMSMNRALRILAPRTRMLEVTKY
jgi:hypothetical protein